MRTSVVRTSSSEVPLPYTADVRSAAARFGLLVTFIEAALRTNAMRQEEFVRRHGGLFAIKRLNMER